MKKYLVRIAASLAVLAVVAQLFRPELTNPQSDPSLSVKNYKGIPPEVASKLETACFDCHSNQTRWLWYSYITPVNYLIAKDVNSGRKRMNFSDWGKLKPGKLLSLLDEIYTQVYNHEMPDPKYRFLHSEARLTDAEVKMICDWASGEQDRLSEEREMVSEQIQQKGETNDSTGAKKTH